MHATISEYSRLKLRLSGLSLSVPSTSRPAWPGCWWTARQWNRQVGLKQLNINNIYNKFESLNLS